MLEIFGMTEGHAHPPDPLPNGKGESSEREGGCAPLSKSLPLLLVGEGDKGDEVVVQILD